MKNILTILSLVLLAMFTGCLSVDRSNSEKSDSGYEVPSSPEAAEVWFFEIAHVGQTGNQLTPFVKARFRKEPTRMNGESILSSLTEEPYIYWTDDQIRFAKEIIKPNGRYWFLSRQGPWSNQQMYLVLEGDDFESAKLIYREIVSRACY